MPACAQPLSTAQRLVDSTPLLGSEAVLGGWAAAYVFGVDWLNGIDPRTGHKVAIDIVSRRLKRRSTPERRYRYADLAEDDVQTAYGIGVTSPIRTAFDGARWAESLEEAVVFADAVAAHIRIRPAALAAYAANHPTMAGVGQARRAARLAVMDVRSTWESRLRMCYLADAGLPAPLVNAGLYSAQGSLLGIPDLFDPESALAVEFDGKQHRDRAQHRRDNIREEAFESANVTVVRVDSLDLERDRAALIARLQDGHHRGLLRNRALDRFKLSR